MARIRPLTEADAPAAAAVASAAFGVEEEPGRTERQADRVAHFARHDPGGAWAAEDAAGALVGVALAIVREGVWGLSLLVVHPGVQARGIGRALLDVALAHGAPHRGGIVLSSQDPKALRRYARAGFALVPTVAAGGVVDRRALPAGLRSRAAGVEEAAPVAAAAGRAVRGAAYAPGDLALMARRGAALLVCGGAGLAFAAPDAVSLVAAPDPATAADLLWSALARTPRGGSVDVETIGPGQDWAVRVCLDAGLALTPWGPLFVRGSVRPGAPWLPSGAFL